MGVPSKGSTVMLLFSIKKGGLPPGVEEATGRPADVKFAIYFSIFAVIVIAEPAEQFSDSLCQEGPEAFGADMIIDWDDEEEGSSAEEEPEEFL